MVYAGWPWYVPDANWDTVRTLMSGLKINRLTALALFQRGLHTVGEAKKYLACDLSDLGIPFPCPGRKRQPPGWRLPLQKEKVLVFGDYDVDGITATALLILVLQELEVPVEYHIPSRFADGYGLQSDVLEEFAARGGSLAVTVDCGTNSFAEMERAREIGLIDNNRPSPCFDGDRPACAVLNPKQQGCRYPENSLPASAWPGYWSAPCTSTWGYRLTGLIATWIWWQWGQLPMRCRCRVKTESW